MNNRQSRLIEGAEKAIVFALQLKKAPARVTEAAQRLKDALRAARAAELKQLGAKHSRTGPRYSASRAKTILLRKHLEAATRVRRVAADHEEEFITARNYDENFLERFDRAVRDLEAAARVERGFARAKYTRTTVDVKEEIARVRRVFDALDTRILETYLDNRHLLKQWRSASRVPAKTGRPKKRKFRLERGDATIA